MMWRVPILDSLVEKVYGKQRMKAIWGKGPRGNDERKMLSG